VVWRPSLSSRLALQVSADAQSLAQHAVGVDEAYLVLRPDPLSAVRISGRAGLFFPPVSLEHDGSEWSLERTLTPSAIDTWIAEEVKVAGTEVTLRTTLAGHSTGITLAAFQGDDTSGALLYFRGWTFDDLRANLGGDFRLPPLPGLFVGKQAQDTQSIDDVDGRWGAYGRIDYALSQTLSVNLFAYDNNGSRTKVVDGQYAWGTRFVQAAARWTPADSVEVLAQAMTGETEMGKPLNGQFPADIGFAAGYVLVTDTLPNGSASLRLEQFSIADHTFKTLYNSAESGWAATAAWTQPLSRRTEVVLEGVFERSDRPDRIRFGMSPLQTSVQGRTAIRAAF